MYLSKNHETCTQRLATYLGKLNLPTAKEKVWNTKLFLNLLENGSAMEKITIELTSKSKRELLIRILDALNITYSKGDNPSPSGDRWFLDSKNIAEVEKGIADIKAGKVKKRTLAEIKAMAGI